MRRKRLQTYETDSLTVTFDPNRCIHASVCVRSLGSVFDPNRKRWIQLEHAAPDEIATVVARCPTGALQVPRPAGAAMAGVESTGVRVMRNGPLFIRGPVRIVTGNGDHIIDDERVALCRCGASAMQPFCDNSHRRIGFRDVE